MPAASRGGAGPRRPARPRGSALPRSGFFELNVVAVLAGGLLALVHAIGVRRTVALVWAGLALGGLTAVILASALLRLRIYQDAYGWTELRFYVLATIVWLAIGIAITGVLLVRDRMAWRIHGLAIAAIVVLVGMNVVGPSRPIAGENVARVLDPSRVPPDAKTGLDVGYVRVLGDDAVPAALPALPALDPADRSELSSGLADRQNELASSEASGWPSWNLGRELARRALEGLPAAEPGGAPYTRRVHLPFDPPLEPMLAKAADGLPDGDGWLYEPKWDGFRAIVFRDGDEVLIQSRDLKPLDRYFPELADPIRASFPTRCIVDGEVVIARDGELDFEALLLRIHPAASRVKMLAAETPASFVGWDLLALDDEDLRATPQGDRRARLETIFGNVEPPVHVTPATRDRALGADWFDRFEGAGLDGVVAKRLDAPYQPGKRAMLKIKHQRTADCVVAGFRWHKNGPGTHIGSLLLGLFDNAGKLHHVGITSSFTWDKRAALATELAPLRENASDGHPWQEWAEWASWGAADASGQRLPGATSRWNRGKDLSWEPLRAERVVEVAYDHLQGDRFRHATTFKRWRPDKPPAECRYDQLEETAAYEIAKIFGT